MRNNIESNNQLDSDRQQLDLPPYPQPQNYPNLRAPVSQLAPGNNIPPNIQPISQGYRDYTISYLKIIFFIIFALIPIILIGIVMGNCPTQYQNQEICYAGSTSYYDYYNSYYYEYSNARMTKSQCCSIYTIFFWIWLGLFLGYLIVNVLVKVVNPPIILLYTRVRDADECCPNCCQAVLLIFFWPIISIIAIISGIIYLLTRLCDHN